MSLFDKYLKKRLGLSSAKEIFMDASRDYLKGDIELSDLSSVASKIYFDIFSASDFGGGEFHTVIEKTADIDYAIKKASEGDEGAKKEIDSLIQDLKSLT